VRQDLGIYRDVAKPFWGPLYQAGRWLGLFLNLLLGVVNPRATPGLTTEKKGRRETQIPEYLGINSNYDFGLIWVCTEKFEFLDLVDFGGVAFSVEFIVVKYLSSYKNCDMAQEHVCHVSGAVELCSSQSINNNFNYESIQSSPRKYPRICSRKLSTILSKF